MMVKFNAGAFALPRFPLSIAFFCLSIAGCSSPSHNAGNQNPFNEHRSPSSTGAHQQPPSSPPRQASPPASKPHPGHRALEYRPAIVIPLQETVGLEVPIEASPISPAEETRPTPTLVDETFNEAMAYGAIGDSAAMIGLLEHSARRGSADAHYQLARIYQEGKLLPADVAQSVTHLNLAMNMGHAESIRVLGWMYLTGNGVPESPAYGRKLLEKSAESSTRAMREYGLALANQRAPHLNDPELGKLYLEKAAELGDRSAHAALAELFGLPAPAAGPEMSPGTPVEISEIESAPAVDDNSAAEVKRRALAGDVDAAHLYALNVSIRKFPSSEPEFDAYCWHAAAAELGSAQSASELRFLAGVKSHSDRKHPGRMDRCVNDLVDLMSSASAQYHLHGAE